MYTTRRWASIYGHQYFNSSAALPLCILWPMPNLHRDTSMRGIWDSLWSNSLCNAYLSPIHARSHLILKCRSTVIQMWQCESKVASSSLQKRCILLLTLECRDVLFIKPTTTKHPQEGLFNRIFGCEEWMYYLAMAPKLHKCISKEHLKSPGHLFKWVALLRWYFILF